MRVVKYEEFCKLPNGTVFSYWQPYVTTGLYRRGDVLAVDGRPIDFYEASLTGVSYNGEDPIVDLVESRWGMFDYDQLFLVYEPNDIATIAAGIGVGSFASPETPSVDAPDGPGLENAAIATQQACKAEDAAAGRP